MATGQVCASCATEASRASPLRVFYMGTASVKLCPICLSTAQADYNLTMDSIGTECASCGSADEVSEHPLIPTLGLQSTTVNLCRSCHAPVKEWHGSMEEARALEELGATATLLEKKRADAIVQSHGPLAAPLAAIGMAPALIAQNLNRRGYNLTPDHQWTAASAAALVQRYRATKIGALEVQVPAPSAGAMAQGN